MTHITLTLPKLRLRDEVVAPLVAEIAHVRAGSRISRLLRKFVTAKKLQRLLGTMLAVLVLVTNLFPPTSTVFSAQEEIVALPTVDAPVATKVLKRFPVDGKPRITQGYHRFHAGVDFDGVTGDPIYPVMNGQVVTVEKSFFLGKSVKITHEGGYVSVYAHLDTIRVKVGQEVGTSSVLGEMGNTGRSFGDHIHLEVEKDGRAINPLSVLPRR